MICWYLDEPSSCRQLGLLGHPGWVFATSYLWFNLFSFGLVVVRFHLGFLYRIMDGCRASLAMSAVRGGSISATATSWFSGIPCGFLSFVAVSINVIEWWVRTKAASPPSQQRTVDNLRELKLHAEEAENKLFLLPHLKENSILEVPGYGIYRLSLITTKVPGYSHVLRLDPKKAKICQNQPKIE